MASEIKTGSYTGTGAAINIELGFVPEAVLLWNLTDGDLVALWSDDMADDTGIDIAAAAAANAADGITPYQPTDLSSKYGFTVGTDYSESAKVFTYIAMRSGDY